MIGRDQLLDLAVNTALKSPMKSKYCAILVHRNKILNVAHNDYAEQVVSLKNIDKFERGKYSIHAEVACLVGCKQKNLIKECTLYIFKYGSDTCQPCSMCKVFIERYGVRRVVC